MIRKENNVLLGTITKTHATKGAVVVWLKNLQAEDLKIKESVFVEIDGLLVPFFIENIKINSSDSLILKFEGIDSETKARTFAGNLVYADKDRIKRNKRLQGDLSIEGFKVIDKKSGYVGIALAISDNGRNPLLHVKGENKEHLIPVHEDIILKIDKKHKEFYINAPEGLLDL